MALHWKRQDADGTPHKLLQTRTTQFLANKTAQAEFLLHCLEKAAGGIGLHVNAGKTEYMCVNQNQRGDISTLNGGSLKLVDKFTKLGSSISSTKNDINKRRVKAWTAVDRLSVICKSYLSDKIKRNLIPAVVVSILQYGCTTWTLTQRIEKKLDGICTRCYELHWTSHGSSIPQNSSCMTSYLSSLKPSKLDEQDKRDTAGEVRTNS